MLRAEALLWLLGLLLLAAWLRGHLGFTRSLRVLQPLPRGGDARVTVVIAARNEEENLRRLLPRLLSTRLHELIVVDDSSTDATARVVEEHAARDPRVRLLRIEETPEGWAPKSYALWLGAAAATGDALLFLDADVEPHEPQRLVEAAASVGEDTVLAVAPRFGCHSPACKAAETAMTAVALGFYGYHRVVSSRDSLAWMYGCCWAVRKCTYMRLGGHRAVARSIVEDRDFAVHAKRSGARIVFARGFEAVTVKAYEELRGYMEQAARLSLDPLRERSPQGRLVFIAAAALLLHGPLLLAPLSPPAAAALVAQLLLYARAAALNRFSPLYAIPALLAAATLPAGMVLAATRGFTWKGRRYPAAREWRVEHE